MDFRKKLKIRLFVAIGYIILGLVMIIVFNLFDFPNNFLSSWGIALIVIGIAQIKKYFLITKNEESIKKRQIAESDERNISIANKAKSISFILYVVLASIAVIVLEFLNLTRFALLISGSVCLLVLIYWISYFIISKRS